MKLFRYQNFIKESNEDIHSICRKYDIRNYTINEDLSVDVDGSVNLHSEGISELPIKFGKVSGNFYCNSNLLLNLVGSPSEVGGDFYCSGNQLTSLEGAPEKVGASFYCHNNQLKSLEGSPHEVGNFYCSSNQLTSLKGISQIIRGIIYCKYNKLRDVKGVPDGWSGEFSIGGNPVYEIFKLFPYERRDEVVELLNEYNVIRDGKLVILQGLEQIFLEMGLEVPEIEKIEGYDIQF
jgi:hypothetical protein